MADDVLAQNDSFVHELRSALIEGAAGLADVPMLLKKVLRDGCWCNRRIKTGDEVPFERFEDFVTTKPLEGLGSDMGLIKRICDGDSEAMDLLDQALKAGERKPGPKPRSDNNVNQTPYSEKPQGNSEQSALRRLRKDRPDLHARVIAKDISAHAAMVKAGFRVREISVPLDPQAAARRLVRHFTREQFAELVTAALAAYGVQATTADS